MRCKICGSELSEKEQNARFCDRCGSKVEIDDNEEEIQPHYYHVEHSDINQNTTVRKPKRVFIPLHLLAVISLALIFAFVGIFFAVRHTPEDDMIKINTLFATSIEANYISNFSEGLAVVRTGSDWNPKCGYIDMTGEIIIPCEYGYANDFSEGLACVFKDKKWGFIDKTGEEIIPFQYKYAESFQSGLALIVIDEKHGYINRSGEEVIPCEYEHARSFINELAIVGCMSTKGITGSQWGLIDKSGDIVVPLEYDWINYMSNGFYSVSTADKCGLVDKSGEFILPCIYDSINLSRTDGLIYVQQKGKWGIFEIEGYESDPYENHWNGHGFYYR